MKIFFCVKYYLIVLLLWLSALLVRADDYMRLYKLPAEEVMTMGRNYILSKEHREDSALMCFRVICDRYEEQPRQEMRDMYIRAINNNGILYAYRYFDYPQAYQCFCKAYELAIEHQLDTLQAITAINLVDLLNKYSLDYPSSTLRQECVKLSTVAAQAAIRVKLWDALATAFIDIADVDQQIELSPYEALMCEEAPDSLPNMKYAKSLYKAIEMLKLNRYDEARQYIEQNFSNEVFAIEADRYHISNYYNLAVINKEAGLYSCALENLDSALVLIDRYGNADGKPRVMKLKADINKIIGDTMKYDLYHIAYLESREELALRRHSQMLAEMDFLHKINSEQEKVSMLHHRERMMSTSLMVAAVVVVLLATLCLVIYRQKRQLAEINQGLYERIQRDLALHHHVSTPFDRLDEERKDDIWNRVVAVMEEVSTICSEDFSIAVLAKRVESNVNYVSGVINERSGQAFSGLLSEYRIREACRRMNDTENYGRYTIEAISKSVGFKSRVTFVNSFKKQLSLTPSEYMRIAKLQPKA